MCLVHHPHIFSIIWRQIMMDKDKFEALDFEMSKRKAQMYYFCERLED